MNLPRIDATYEASRATHAHPGELALVIDNVVKYFGDEKARRPWTKQPAKEPVKAVDHISLSVRQGEIFPPC
jgi:ABC-type glutathione transport system ATPase component